MGSGSLLIDYAHKFALIGACPSGSDGKASVCNAGYPGSTPGSGRSPGEGNGSPLQYSCLENPMDPELAKLLSVGLPRVKHVLFTFCPD